MTGSGERGGRLLLTWRAQWIHLIERVLKLSVPNLYVWLVFFMVFFHYWFNITAELLRFGDRRFYGDWWNASSLGVRRARRRRPLSALTRRAQYYWRNWNLPVHMFMVRHVYVPIRASGASKAVVRHASDLLAPPSLSSPLASRRAGELCRLPAERARARDAHQRALQNPRALRRRPPNASPGD